MFSDCSAYAVFRSRENDRVYSGLTSTSFLGADSPKPGHRGFDLQKLQLDGPLQRKVFDKIFISTQPFWQSPNERPPSTFQRRPPSVEFLASHDFPTLLFRASVSHSSIVLLFETVSHIFEPRMIDAAAQKPAAISHRSQRIVGTSQ